MAVLRSIVGRRSPLSVAVLGTIIAAHAFALAVSACSCVEPQPMAAYAPDPRSSVLTGVPGPLVARGVAVTVTRWFKGPGASSVIWLAASSFGAEGASCQRMAPTAGQELILVLYMPEDGSDPSGNICTPIARLDEADGQAMLADAMATFRTSTVPLASPTPAEGEAPIEILGSLLPAIVGIAAGAALLALVVGVLALITRARPEGPRGSPPATRSDGPRS